MCETPIEIIANSNLSVTLLLAVGIALVIGTIVLVLCDMLKA